MQQDWPRGLWQVTAQPGAPVAQIAWGYATHGFRIWFPLQWRTLERLRQALPGVSLTLGDVFGPDGELREAFLLAHAPELAGSFPAIESDGARRETLLEAGPNPFFTPENLLPFAASPFLARNNLLNRPDRPALELIARDDAELFVNEHVFMCLSRDGGACDPSLSTRVLSRLVVEGPVETIDAPLVIVRDCHDESNFAHFLCDVLARIVLVCALRPDLAARAIFLVGGPRRPVHQLAVALACEAHGLRPEQFRFQTEPVTLRPSGGLFGFSNLGRLWTHPMHLGHPTVVALLRQVLGRLQIGRSPARRLYISRADAKRRRIGNEVALEAALTARGFRCVAMSPLPLRSQIELVCGAHTIVAPHGMALALLAFHRGEPETFEIFNPHAGTAAFLCVSRALGCPHTVLIGDGDANDPRLDYTIDPDTVLAALDAPPPG